MWAQPLAPLGSVSLSGLVAAIPLVVVLLLMGVWRRSGLFSSACGLATAALLAIGVWHMPITLALWSVAFGFAFALLPILWIVFAALWLYNLTVETGSFEALRRWMLTHASSDACVQAMLVAFCFGALLEGSAGFGAPVAVTAFLLVGLGFEARKAVVVALLANTAPVAFGAVGVPIVALAGVTGLDLMQRPGQQAAVRQEPVDLRQAQRRGRPARPLGAMGPFQPPHLLAQQRRQVSPLAVGGRGSKGIWGNDGHRPLDSFPAGVSKIVLFLF